MQIDNTSASSTNRALNQTAGFGIKSEFYINSFHFSIISINEFANNHQSISDRTCIEKFFSVLGYFEFNGNSYAIIHTPNSSDTVDSTLTSRLTGRELQIAALVALGQSNKQVAKQLHISEWTVSAHLRRIFVKLKIDSRAAMVYQCASLINQLHQLGLSSTSFIPGN